MSKLDGGAYDINYIPELTALAEENLNFSHTDQVGGAYEVEGIRWTVASMFAQTSGLPLLIPIARNAMNGQEVFFPKVWSLGIFLNRKAISRNYLLVQMRFSEEDCNIFRSMAAIKFMIIRQH